MIYDICVIGLGYIGVPTAAIFADSGKKVLGVDVLEKRVSLINSGTSHVGESDINAMIAKVVKSGNLNAASKPESAEYYIVAVPTPFKKDHNKKLPDMGFVEAAHVLLLPSSKMDNV